MSTRTEPGRLDADQLASVAIEAMRLARVAWRARDWLEAATNLRLARYASIRCAWELASARGAS